MREVSNGKKGATKDLTTAGDFVVVTTADYGAEDYDAQVGRDYPRCFSVCGDVSGKELVLETLAGNERTLSDVELASIASFPCGIHKIKAGSTVDSVILFY